MWKRIIFVKKEKPNRGVPLEYIEINQIDIFDDNLADKQSASKIKIKDRIAKLEAELKNLKKGKKTDKIAAKEKQIQAAKQDLKNLDNNSSYDKKIAEAKAQVQAKKDKITSIKNGVKKEPAQINIKIDKNTANPYAVIRSELEHARDELMGTTPKDANVEGSGTHFSRYAGDNESEASVEYVKRKADKRAINKFPIIPKKGL